MLGKKPLDQLIVSFALLLMHFLVFRGLSAKHMIIMRYVCMLFKPRQHLYIFIYLLHKGLATAKSQGDDQSHPAVEDC